VCMCVCVCVPPAVPPLASPVLLSLSACSLSAPPCNGDGDSHGDCDSNGNGDSDGRGTSACSLPARSWGGDHCA
jgi:hypothetical protein